MPSHETQFIWANGLQFEVLTAGAGDRLALLLHGFPELNVSWRHQIPLLARLGYRVWAPNLRGYGRTSRPSGVAAYHIDHLLADVAGLIDAAAAREVTLIAHDWGAAIAWLFAIKDLRPLSRLVIMNVPHPLCMRREMRTLRQLRKSWYMFFFQLPRLPEWVLSRREGAAIASAFRDASCAPERFPPHVTDPYRLAALQPGALTAMINYYRAAARTDPAVLFPAPGLVHVPTLMVWGEADVALDLATTHGTQNYVPDLTLRTLPGVSHWVQQEAPEIVNPILEAFLTGAPVPTAAALRAEPH